MDIVALVQLNLLSPMVLAFVLGIVATLVHSDLKFPTDVYTALSIYLLLAIGLKGGVELSRTSLAVIWAPMVVTLVVGIATPIWSYAILRRFGKLDVANAAALAAHYGSVSAVTFAASQTLLQSLGVPFEGYMPALVAILEVPAIIVALMIARTKLGSTGSWGEVTRELVAGKSILLLVGGMVIGFLAGEAGYKQVSPFFADPFRGVLTIFLLELGMIAAQRFRDLKKVGGFLLGFGILMPLFHGMLGVWLGSVAGLSMGGSVVLAALFASASYIAAPAAVRIALPQASPGYYLTAAIGITFPFNLAIGIPLYYTIARALYGAP